MYYLLTYFLPSLLQLVKDIDNRITILIERGGAPLI
jgi:hypothetical protein